VHHEGKRGEADMGGSTYRAHRGRGASAAVQFAQMTMHLETRAKLERGQLVLGYGKFKDEDRPDDIVIEHTNSRWFKLNTDVVLETRTAFDRMLAALALSGDLGMTRSELMDDLGVSRDTISNHVGTALKQNPPLVIERGKRDRQAVLFLTPEARTYPTVLEALSDQGGGELITSVNQ
jgi:DNA-binding MarR family transcriptional regulator